MNISKRLEELEIELPPCPKPRAAYVSAVLSEEFIFVSGQTPKRGDKLIYKGKIGRDLSVQEGYEAAKICALNCLGAIKELAGDLDNIEKIVQVTGYVNCIEEFENHSKVLDGVSELLVEIFGSKGKHARVAVGVSSLSGNAPVEIEMIVRV